MKAMYLKTRLSIITLCLPFLVQAQHGGIQFTEAPSWQQILKKAKIENKYIFVDCYTTWCGPCKRMENEVFSVDSVGQYMNENFIPVRVQMDQTPKDEPTVKSWYKDAEKLGNDYKIEAYPTFLFFSPDGHLVDKQTSFRQPNEFLSMAKKAGNLTGNYKDPYAEYYALVALYKKGRKNFKKMPYMIKTARDLGDPMYSKIVREYLDYLEQRPKEQLYIKDNLDFLGTIMTTTNRFFRLFQENSEKIDQVMGNPWFTKGILFRLVHNEEVLPYLKTVALMNFSPQWQDLQEQVAKKFPPSYAEWAIDDAKVTWFQYRDDEAYIDAYLTQVEKYGTDTTVSGQDLDLNNHFWIVFEKSNDVSQLNRAIQLMEGVIRRNHATRPMAIAWDTYANLLYKVGRTKEAIEWEEKAMEQVKAGEFYSPSAIEEYNDTVNKMKIGIPTWSN
jgi:thioredoxin-related protein